jgi:hypothetical protein
MKIVWITSGDDLLIAHQFKYYLENNSGSTCRVISFNKPKNDAIYDIVVSEFEKLHEEFQLPNALDSLMQIIRESDLIISSHGVIKEYESGDFLKLDGHYATVANIKMWLLTIDKPKVIVLFNNNSLQNHPEWFANAYNAIGCPIITYDTNVYALLKDKCDIRLLDIVIAEEILSISDGLKEEMEKYITLQSPKRAFEEFKGFIEESTGLCVS